MRAHCSPKLLDELTRTVLYLSTQNHIVCPWLAPGGVAKEGNTKGGRRGEGDAQEEPPNKGGNKGQPAQRNTHTANKRQTTRQAHENSQAAKEPDRHHGSEEHRTNTKGHNTDNTKGKEGVTSVVINAKTVKPDRIEEKGEGGHKSKATNDREERERRGARRSKQNKEEPKVQNRDTTKQN